MVFDNVSKEVKQLSVTFFIGHLGSSMMWLFLPVFFRMHIESVFLVGVLTSIPGLVTVVLDVPVGNLVQKASSRMVMFVGLGAFSLPGLIYFTALPAMLFLGKIIEGFSKTFRWESGWYIAMINSNDDNESETLSVFSLGKIIADVIGPIIGGVIAFYLSFKYNLLSWTFFGLIALVYFYSTLGVSTRNFGNAFHSLFRRKTYLEDWKHLKENWSSLKFSVLFILLQALLFSFFWVSVPLILEELGANYLYMGLIFGVVAIPRMFQVYFGELADSKGWLRTVFWLSLSIIPVLFAMSTVNNLLILGIFILIANLIVSALSPPLHSYYDYCSPDQLEGEMVGFLEFFKHVGQGLGPFIAGTVSSMWNISASFIAAGFVGILMCLLVSYVKLKT